MPGTLTNWKLLQYTQEDRKVSQLQWLHCSIILGRSVTLSECPFRFLQKSAECRCNTISSFFPFIQIKMCTKFPLAWLMWFFSSVVASSQTARFVGKEHGWKFNSLYTKWHIVSPLFWDQFCLWFIEKAKYKIPKCIWTQSFKFHFFLKCPTDSCNAAYLVLQRADTALVFLTRIMVQAQITPDDTLHVGACVCGHEQSMKNSARI